MTLQEALYTLLSTNAGLTALVGANIFAGVAPDDLTQYPCVSYALAGGSTDVSLDTSGVIRQRVELNGHAITYAAAAGIRAAIVAAVNGWQQQVSGDPNVLNAVLLNPGTDFVTEDRIFRAMVEFYFLYTTP